MPATRVPLSFILSASAVALATGSAAGTIDHLRAAEGVADGDFKTTTACAADRHGHPTTLGRAAVGRLGILHADTDSRPSLACDLMEVVRTHVDEYVLNWITKQTLRREWFFEEREGNCRLMAGFAARLAEAAPGLASAVVPVAERVAKALTSARADGRSLETNLPESSAPANPARLRTMWPDSHGRNRNLQEVFGLGIRQVFWFGACPRPKDLQRT